ncbi:ABC transporter [Akanthomyces lecanii RCEF 1005]|uniref:ABC transporter n=1 Tax=Akanthomyces lecanii RCEF 1005 TaxID=1081108 RepID=A0A168DIK4_CORDF|nr:ABC transporter [Akanthomyces lecanii RCEF 1005]
MFFVTELIKPLGMYYLLDYLANPADAVFQPYIWLFVIMVGKLFGTIVQQQLAFHSGRASLKLQIALTGEMYSHAMQSRELDHDFLSSSGLKDAKRSSTGLLTNLMSTDIKTIMQGRILIMVIFGGPVGGIIGLVSLYKIIGWPCLVGLAITLLGTPITAWISNYASDAEEKAKDSQDTRVSLSTEYFRSIKIVKYFGWEDVVAEQMEKSRDEEQSHLWNVALFSTASTDVAYMIPSLALVVVFALYAGVQGNPITASVAFITIDLMEIVRDNTTVVSVVGRMVPKLRLSMKRIDRYIAAASPKHTFPEGRLIVKSATFQRTASADFRLRDISVDFVHAGLNVVVGPSGSGKTSLLLSILGETVLEDGKVTKPRDVAFASQRPWLQARSLRDNILFTSTYNATKYRQVIKACCLDVDLEELTGGDETNIGENGQLLSGGQRARVSLARALLSDAPLLLLDDIFSALDSTTAISLWNNVFCSSLLKGRTIVLVTQLPWIAAEGDCVVTMENGRATTEKRTVTRSPKSVTGAVNREAAKHLAQTETSMEKTGSAPEDECDEEVATLQARHPGRFQWMEYIGYFGNLFTIALTMSTLVIFILTGMATDLWLTSWVDIEDTQSSPHTAYHLGIYIFLSLFTTFSEGITNLAFMRGSWVSARKLHSLFVHAVLNTSIGWLEKTSIGGIMGRLSSDLDSLDQNTSEPLREFLDEAFKAIMMLGAITNILPLIAAPAIVLSMVGALVGEVYSRAIKMVKNIASSAQAPVISRLSETIDGMAVIRARSDDVQSAFDETIFGLLHNSARAAAAHRDCDQWLKFRMSLLSALINVVAGIMALRASGHISAGLVGFSLAQASSLSNGLLRLVFKLNELNLSMQSFQRVKEYCHLPPEEEPGSRKTGTLSLSPSWPQSSQVEFRNVTVRYSPDGADVLKKVSFSFDAGERSAIVGRTGSGKSTVILSILGFTHIVSGKILYDGVDIATVPRRRLRQAIGMVPQDALLFQGTVRMNLDPSNTIPDSDLNEFLSMCASLNAMKSQAKNDSLQSDLTLDTPVSPGGNNFSHGQRQVLSLCRAMVRKNKLTLLDEATSSVDMGTDSAIQGILRAQLSGGQHGLITVAHRLKTVLDYDKVVVMGFGKVLEMGSPTELLDSKCKFYDMMEHSGGAE